MIAIGSRNVRMERADGTSVTLRSHMIRALRIAKTSPTVKASMMTRPSMHDFSPAEINVRTVRRLIEHGLMEWVREPNSGTAADMDRCRGACGEARLTSDGRAVADQIIKRFGPAV